ncbi:MAG TPA: YceI family protein [Mycobacterium sp.]|uniref:YceI family protein n=1 Tax=Mycobacterium sp. TaxID=1785 RepID=UPI002F40AB0A
MTQHDSAVWSLDGSHGELLIHTGVAGRAAQMGHRLTIAMRSWQATTQWDSDQPVSAELTVDVGSLEVVRGEGGLTPLSGPEKILVRSNALRSLDARRFPLISFSAETIEKTDDGYRLTGTLAIHGKTRAQTVEVRTDDLDGSWWLSSETTVRQSDFGIKPYSQLLGSLKVADDVTVLFTAECAKEF